MARNFLSGLALVIASAGPAGGATFDRVPISPDDDVEIFSRGVAVEALDRALLGRPYDAVTIGHVDVYDVFPYLESRYFQVISDPGWSRLLYGEGGAGFSAFDGAGSSLGPLDEPRGLAADGAGRVFVADTGNDRVLVLRARTEHEHMWLEPLFAIHDLARPHDVAFSDGGTPFDPIDDRLYVADTGRNRVVAFHLDATGADRVAETGRLGSGTGGFGGPTAIAVGRREGASTNDVFVADAHAQRLVRLRDDGASLAWMGAVDHADGVVTSLDTDHFGSVYAAAPNAGRISKYDDALRPLAALTDALARPRSFHVPFLNVTDHRTGTKKRAGQPSGVVVESWTETTGVRLYGLGIEARDLAIDAREGDVVTASFVLTDPADVTVELTDLSSGRTVAREHVGARPAGSHTITVRPERVTGGDHVLRVHARSRYEGGDTYVAQATVVLGDEGPSLAPAKPALLGHLPNPAREMSRIGFLVPAGTYGGALVRIYDVTGRLVREIARERLEPGRNEIVWDGRDARGLFVPAGSYLYRLDVADAVFTDKMVVIQ